MLMTILVAWAALSPLYVYSAYCLGKSRGYLEGIEEALEVERQIGGKR